LGKNDWIWAHLFRFGQNQKSCISKNFQSPTAICIERIDCKVMQDQWIVSKYIVVILI